MKSIFLLRDYVRNFKSSGTETTHAAIIQISRSVLVNSKYKFSLAVFVIYRIRLKEDILRLI